MLAIDHNIELGIKECLRRQESQLLFGGEDLTLWHDFTIKCKENDIEPLYGYVHNQVLYIAKNINGKNHIVDVYNKKRKQKTVRANFEDCVAISLKNTKKMLSIRNLHIEFLDKDVVYGERKVLFSYNNEIITGTHFTDISRICWNELSKRMLGSEYVDRLEYELQAIKDKGYGLYLSIVKDYVTFCHDNRIAFQARGSAIGSLVVYLLGISNINPLIYNLSFERFINGHDPDVDLDIDSSKKELVINYLLKKYDGFVYQSYSESSNGTRVVSTSTFYIDPYYKHPAEWLKDSFVIRKDKAKHLMKFDLLSSIAIQKYDSINCKSIDYSDKTVWDSIVNDQTGLFQIDTEIGKKFIPQFKPKTIEELAQAIALMRSGSLASGAAYNYIKIKENALRQPKINSIYDSVTRDTYGLLIYQEQFLLIMSKFISYEEAYELMKDKNLELADKVDIIAEQYNFLELRTIYRNVVKYSYNKAHAISYAMLIYRGAYLRQYYKDEFFEIPKKEKEIVYIDLLTSPYKTEIKTNKVIVGVKEVKGMTKKIYNELLSMTADNFWSTLLRLPEKTVLSLIQLNVLYTMTRLSPAALLRMYSSRKNKEYDINVYYEEEYKKLKCLKS